MDLYLVLLSTMCAMPSVILSALAPHLHPNTHPTPVPFPPDSLIEGPEGYMAFIEAPRAEPPRVKPPPYTFAKIPCPGVGAGAAYGRRPSNNLCGDLNKEVIPMNPLGQNVLGSPYPFELIKNKTLQFLSRTLPILQGDDSLPKVAKSRREEDDGYRTNRINGPSRTSFRHRRSSPTTEEGLVNDQETLRTFSNETSITQREDMSSKRSSDGSTSRHGRKFCDNGGGVMCMLYKAIQGEPLASGMKQGPERREEVNVGNSGNFHDDTPSSPPPPPTPCPAKVEYATPLFARNYQGVWRYVVQIPYEGYLTQTVEVTRCMQSKCHYLDGACLSSPRWVSLLVAEIFYPDAVLPQRPRDPPSPSLSSHLDPLDQKYPQYVHRRHRRDMTPAGNSTTVSTGRSSKTSSSTTHCDGVDKIGCFQVRLYYDWFLIPGSCKCWRPDYFSRYVRRKNNSPDL